PAQGIPLGELGGSLAVGVIITGILSVVIGLTGMGSIVAKLFNANVMGVFMFLLGLQLVSNFVKGMLGIPFVSQSDSAQIDLSVKLFSVVIVFHVMFLEIRAPFEVKKYSFLIGIGVGWNVYTLFFKQEQSIGTISSFSVELFPLGRPSWNIGVIVTRVI